jgi:hypothetical protein
MENIYYKLIIYSYLMGVQAIDQNIFPEDFCQFIFR